MLHEILYALLGKIGNIVLEIDGVFRLNPNIDFITEGERELLEKIIALGSLYKQLMQYLDEDSRAFHSRGTEHCDQVLMGKGAGGGMGSETLALQNQDSVIGNSAYIRCLCYAVKDMMQEYEQEILAVEQEYLGSKVYTFSKLIIRLSRYYALFPEALVMIRHVRQEGLKGGQLMDLLMHSSIHGNEFIKEFYQMLLEKLYTVLYNQIVIWIIHGKLFDKFDEFFIYKLKNSDKEDKGKQNITNQISWRTGMGHLASVYQCFQES